MASLDDYRKQELLKRSGVDMYSQGPFAAAKQPKPSTPAAPAGPGLIQRAFPNTMGAISDRRSEIDAARKTGGIGAAIGQSARTVANPLIGFLDDSAGMVKQALDPAAQALKTAVTGDATPIGQSPLVSAASKAPVPQATYSNEARNTPPAMQTEAQKAMPSQMSDAVASNPLARQIAPGIYRQGNSFSDTPDGAAAGARPAPISAQNMAAADALAARSSTQNPLMQAAGGGEQNWTARDNAIMAANIRDGVDPYRGTSVSPNPIVSVINDTSGGNGMSWEEAGRERSLRMAAERLVPGAKTALKAFYESMGMRQEGKSREREANADRSFRAGESARDRLMRGQELSARLGESAADRSLKSQELADNMKTNDVKRQAAGVELTGAQRLQALQGEFLNAETDAARDAAAKKLQGLSGKAPAADWGVQVTPGVKNIDGSTTEGSVYRFNKATGEVQRVDGQQTQAGTAMPPPNQRPVGATFTVNGKTAVWNGTKWVPQ